MPVNLGPMLPGNVPTFSPGTLTTTNFPTQGVTYSPMPVQQQATGQPGFFDQLGQGLSDPLKKIGYGLGYRLTSGGQNPPMGSFGEAPKATPRFENYNDTGLAKGFLEQIIGEIMDKKKKESSSPLLEDKSTEAIRAFGDFSLDPSYGAKDKEPGAWFSTF